MNQIPISRRTFLGGLVSGAALLSDPLTSVAWTGQPAARAETDSVVVRFNQAVLEAVEVSTLGPPMVARAIAVVHACMYEAWAAYDRHAVGVRLGGHLRQPRYLRTFANKRAAVSQAGYRAGIDLFPASATTIFAPLMQSLAYDPEISPTGTQSARGVGNAAADAVLAFCHRDGANQLGDEPGGQPGVPYSDYTGYVAANPPMDLRYPFDRASVSDPSLWQPLRYLDRTGALVTQPFVGAQWGSVKPFALARPNSLRSPDGPARYGSPEYQKQAHELIQISADLTDEQKVIAEFWQDGPQTYQPPGHWCANAQFVTRRDRVGTAEEQLDRDMKLFFAVTAAIFDASICAWDNKRAYNSVRPITAIRYLYDGQQITAWGGPGQPAVPMDGAQWLPYQAATFPTPPFCEYASGHSCFSAAAAEALRLFTGSQRFGASVTIPAGSSKFEPGRVPAETLTLSWRTFKDAADQAGISRRYGGIHFRQGDLDARRAGKRVGSICFRKAHQYYSAL